MADYTEAKIRAVRLMIPDTDAIYGAAENEYIFTDDDIKIYLDEGHGNAKWAAGLAALAVGGSEALVLKVIRNYETQTNGAQLQDSWLKKGALLIKEGREEVYDDENVGIFEIAYPEWSAGRHPEGLSHGAYRGVMPGAYQW